MLKQLIVAGIKALFGESVDDSHDIKEEITVDNGVDISLDVECSTDRSSRHRERQSYRSRSRKRSNSQRTRKSMPEVNVLNVSYDRIYKSDDFFQRA